MGAKLTERNRNHNPIHGALERKFPKSLPRGTLANVDSVILRMIHLLCVAVCMARHMCGGQRKIPKNQRSLLPCGSQGSNSVCQADNKHPILSHLAGPLFHRFKPGQDS